MSPASEDGLYMDPDEFLGQPIDEVLPPDVAQRAMEKIQQTVESGDQQRLEYELDLPAGTRRFEARTYPLTETLNSKQLVTLVTRDITNLTGGVAATEKA